MSLKLHVKSVYIALYHFHLCPPQFKVNFKSWICSVRKNTFTRYKAYPMVVMYLDVEKHYPFQEVLMRAIKNEEKSKKCNQCDYATSRAASLRTHLKTHSGEKSNKCSECDYASFRAHHVRSHMKTHFVEQMNKCSQCDFKSSYARAL